MRKETRDVLIAGAIAATFTIGFALLAWMWIINNPQVIN